MNRQALRDTYPFHNPRQHVTCCKRRAADKRPLSLGFVVWLAILATCAAIILKSLV